ncbi:PLP-dependent aminotransferase family protein [Fulvivirgaceae bacterium BMA10]|uniref:PLP-dependent aminotransferase family protein n=1 Tax=Splendidivirga corallicola TaxID=3051826 RepID=A0ABT8L0D3_9BACT|nr:PLP-dependent aminotransferase family protein [Fulvivirgaceae bacterium BMA10]
MYPWKSTILIDKTSKQPVFLQIANIISSEIRAGRLKPETKLPGSRSMAELLNVHRKTVVAAYDELDAQGWIELKASKGTFVSASLPTMRPVKLDPKVNNVSSHNDTSAFLFNVNTKLTVPPVNDNNLIKLHDGLPDVRLAPTEIIAREYKRVIKDHRILKYGDEQGDFRLREILSQYLNETRGIPSTPYNIFITRGSQMSIYLAAKLLLEPGSKMIVGKTSYYIADQAFESAGAELIRIPVDDQGVCIESMEELCSNTPIKAIYLTPHHHYPTTVTMSIDRRLKLLELAQRYHFAILEDDYDYEFHYKSSPILPIASLDHSGSVIYFGSFTKALAPALRIGYIIAPEDFTTELRKIRRFMDRQGDQILERAFANMIYDGEIQRHLKKAVKIYKDRRDFMCQLLHRELNGAIDADPPEGGLAIWAKFRPHIDLPLLAKNMEDQGIYISDGTHYNPEGPRLNASRLGFAALNKQETERVIQSMKGLL